MTDRTRTSAHDALIPSVPTDKPARQLPRKSRREPLPAVPDIMSHGAMGYLDGPRLDAWEDNLKGRDITDWTDFKGVMRRSDRNMRAAMLAFIVQDELQRARDKYLHARNVSPQPYKAVLLAHAGKVAVEAIKGMDPAVWKMLDLSRQLQGAVTEAGSAADRVKMAIRQAAQLGGGWGSAAKGAAKSGKLAAAFEGAPKG